MCTSIPHLIFEVQLEFYFRRLHWIFISDTTGLIKNSNPNQFVPTEFLQVKSIVSGLLTLIFLNQESLHIQKIRIFQLDRTGKFSEVICKSNPYTKIRVELLFYEGRTYYSQRKYFLQILIC